MSETRRARILLATAAAAVVLALPRATQAEPIGLTVDTTTSIQQVLNTPCVIGDPSCRNPESFPFTLLEPQMASATVSSPTYTAAQIAAMVGGNTFDVGVDLNQAPGHDDGAYRLLAFTMSINGAVVYSLPSPVTLMPINPGNGYSDALIQGFDLSGVAPTATVVFTATFAGGTAGREQYFLRTLQNGGGGDDDAPVPEPASLLLVGSGIAGLLLRRHRRRAAR